MAMELSGVLGLTDSLVQAYTANISQFMPIYILFVALCESNKVVHQDILLLSPTPCSLLGLFLLILALASWFICSCLSCNFNGL